jgi:hypothetical protein
LDGPAGRSAVALKAQPAESRSAVAQSNVRKDSATGGTSAASQGTPAQQRTEGEFERLVKIPAACETAREFGISGRWKSQLAFREPIQVGRRSIETPGPACLAAESCFQGLKSQAAAGVEYLTRNPAVSDALSTAGSQKRSTAPITHKLQQLLSTHSGTSWGPNDRCTLVWIEIDSNWFSLTDRLPPWQGYPFSDFSTAGQALLQKVRADYAADDSEYQQLLTFNDRYTGVERLERAHASYQQAFENDDLSAMINERPAMLQGLEQARARKQLLMQQSGQLTQYEHAVADFVTAINQEGLTGFVFQQTHTTIGELRSELASLSQMAPSKRGDILPKLDIFATRIGAIESAIDSARPIKAQAEQTRQKLVESEGAARRVLDAANGEELKGAFDDEFRNSANGLLKHFRGLESSDLWIIQQKHEDIEVATRQLAMLQNQILDAEARYDRAKKLDSIRQPTNQKIARALSELAQPEFRGKLGKDGLSVISSLKAQQDTLSDFDRVRLIDRIDYSETLVAVEGSLAKTQQFKEEILEVDQLFGDLEELNNRIDRRGRRFLDGPTSSTIADIGKQVRTSSSVKIPLTSEARVQLSNTRVALNRIQDVIDNVMDREEMRILRGALPAGTGAWRFSFDQDKITDEERVQAFANAESSQAKYGLTVKCGKRGGELVIATFVPLGTDPKRIPWSAYGPNPDREIRLRIDSNPAFGAILEMRGYVNQGQVIPASAQFNVLLHSSRLVFSDVFPEEQVEVATAFPAQFTRLCELITPPRPSP